MNRHSRSTRALVEAALMIALATILGYFRLYRFPQGGSVDFAMVPILIYCLRWGPAWSLSCCFVNGVLQFFLGGGIALSWQSMLLDYLVAFPPLGLAGLFKGKKWGIFAGTVLGCLGRFIVHFISGITIYRIYAPTEILGTVFDEPNLYSLVYNGSYMLPNTILALTIAGLLYAPLKKFYVGEDIPK